MLFYEPSLDPFCDYWTTYGKNEFIMNKVPEICESIANQGSSSPFEEIFDLIYIHIEENINDFYPKVGYDSYE